MTSPQRLSTDSVVQRSSGVMAAEVDQDLVMVSIASGFYYGTSGVAREIWEAIEHPKKVSELIHELTESYDVEGSLCEEQTLSFLQDLLTDNLLEVSDDSSR